MAVLVFAHFNNGLFLLWQVSFGLKCKHILCELFMKNHANFSSVVNNCVGADGMMIILLCA
jgi:hypothetical protein